MPHYVTYSAFELAKVLVVVADPPGFGLRTPMAPKTGDIKTKFPVETGRNHKLETLFTNDYLYRISRRITWKQV